MDLPIKFPSDAEVMAEDVARFRALSPEEQGRSLGKMLHLYQWLAELSPQPEAIARLAAAEEAAGRSAIEEFVARRNRG